MEKLTCHKLDIKSMSDNGKLAGYASLYNVVDSYNDVILPGAFGVVFDASMVKLLWQHDPKLPIGMVTKLEETPKGLYVEAKILTTIEKGREACELLKAGIIDGLSIGFEALEHRLVGQHRYISKLKLWEISIVTFPANTAARVTDMRTKERFVESLDRAINSLQVI